MEYILIGFLIAIGVYFAPVIIVAFVSIVAFLLSLPVMVWQWLAKPNKDQW